MNKDKDKDKEAEKVVLDKLKQKRSTIKAITTRLLNKINDIIIDENADVMDLEESKEHLIQKEAELIKLDEEIETAIQDLDELDKDIEKSREYRDRITSVKFKINKILKRANEQAEKLVINSEDKVNKTTDLPSGSEHKNRARLPKLSIGLYDGNPETFTEFWSQFKSAIHENDTLSKIDKFSYLKSLLTGSAAVALKGLLISETNYDISIGILEQRYGRKDILVRAHVNNLLNLNPVRNVYNIKELRDLYDSCEVQIRNLEALGVELSSYGNLLFPMLMKLIPNSLVLEFNKDKKEEEAWDVRVFLKFFKAEIENRERTMMFNKKYDEETQGRYSAKPVVNKYTNPNSLKVTSDKRTGEKINKKIPSAYALNTSVNNTCLFCEGCSDHTIEACIKPVTEKKNALKAQGRCYSCLGRSHVSRFCFKRIKCKQCNGNHSELICERANPSNKINTPNDSSGKDTAVSSLQSVPDRKQICLQSLKVTAAGIRGRRDVRCLCDSGSQRTFILETVSKALHLKILGEERITIYSFGSKDPVIEKRKRVQLVLRDSQQPKRKIVIEALETPSISGAQISTPGKEIRNYCRRENLRLADGGGNSKDLEISVLIGSDNYWKVVTGRIHRISRSLVLCQTIFGWVVNGTSGSSETSTNQSVVNVMKSTTSNVDTDCDVKNLLRDFWSLEKLGIEPENDNNITDEHILDEFNQNIKFKGDRYEVKLPWNERVGELGDNYEVALSRLNSLAKRFVRNPELHERYEGVIAEYLEKGIVEEASENADSKLYYIPHQPILREDKLTTKLRIVFDASSHVDGVVSLNQCLNAGPNLTPDLLAILLKFRLHRVAFIGDIEQAFLQILIAKEERDALRFLWINGPIGAHNQFSLQIMRSTRVMFGVTSSPFLLSATIKFHIDKYKLDYPNEFELLNNYLYVDDLVSGEDGENEVEEIKKNVKGILNEASFNMRKWKTNSTSLQNNWDKLDNIPEHCTGHCKVLGYIWDNKEDVLKIEVRNLSKNAPLDKRVTKRDVLKIASKIYDPIGYINAYTIKVKILMQDIWRTGLKWDENLPEELQQQWTEWYKELPKLEHFEFPRHYFDNSSKTKLKDVQLHCYTDASKRAYGAIIYLRYTQDGEVKTRFVISKARVAPLKELSLPRLELMGTLIGARLSAYVQNQIFDKTEVTPYFWSDSSVALHWIKNDPKTYKPFIRNRISEIRQKTEPKAWLYCPGAENPADSITRGESINSLKKNNLYLYGPPWLVKEKKYWPKVDKLDFKVEDADKETKKGEKTIAQANCVIETPKEDLFDINKYSNLLRIYRVTAWIKRFLFNAQNPKDKRRGPLNADELEDAKKYWVTRTQQIYFQPEIYCLMNKRPIELNSKIRILDPFLDKENILRVGGRLQYSSLEFGKMHPMILPNKSYFTDLIIKYNHETVGHGG